MPNFAGGILGSVVFFAGGSFTSGATQAFMHETLLSLGKESEYSKIMGKAQSYGLLGNIVLVSLVPLTYSIYPTLPFILGFICLCISFLLVLSFKDPSVHIEIKETKISFFQEVKNTLPARFIVKMISTFIIFGIASATFEQSTLYRELVFKNLGIPVAYFGFILAFGSLLAAITGHYIHHLKKLKPERFFLFDILYIIGILLIIGLSGNPVIIILAFCLVPAYDRTRNIIYESIVFEEFPRSNYKATLLSIMNFCDFASAIWIPLVFAYTVSQFGIMKGHAIFGLILLAILLPVLIGHNLIKKKTSIST